jgi:MFS family permease
VTARDSRYLPALRVREFRYLWLAGAQSTAGDQLARVALSLLVYGRTHSPAATALTYALGYLPSLIGSAALSGLADRYPRRTVMVWCDLSRFAVLLLLAALPLPTAVIDGFVVLTALLSCPFKAAEISVLPQMLPPEHYPAGSGLRMATDQLCQLTGFAAGGALVAWLGTRPALGVDAGTFALSAGLLRAGLQRRPAAARPGTSDSGTAAARSTRERAVRLVTSSSALRTLLALIWAAALLSAPEAIAAPYAVRLGGGATLTGVLMAAIPAGAVVGLLLLPRLLSDQQRRSSAAMLAVCSGLCLVACAWIKSTPGTLALLFASGVASAYLLAIMPWFVQEVPDRMRGRVIGFGQGGLVVCQGAVLAAAGPVTAAWGPQWATAAAGVCVVAVAAALHPPLARVARTRVAGDAAAKSTQPAQPHSARQYSGDD